LSDPYAGLLLVPTKPPAHAERHDDLDLPTPTPSDLDEKPPEQN
jgi:hypothetical protein